MKKDTKNITKKPHSSHDLLFKQFYSSPKLAKELLQLIFSKKELTSYNLNKLRLEKDTADGKRADLVLSVPFKKHPKIRPNIFILLEHKSHNDKHIFDQLLDYQVLIRKHCIKQLGSPQPIIPVLFYHGKQPLKAKTSLQEQDFGKTLYDIPNESRKIMLDYGLKVIDTNSDKIKRACKDKRFSSHGIIKLLSKIWDIKKPKAYEIGNIFVDCGDVIKELRGSSRSDAVLSILDYLSNNVRLDLGTWHIVEELLLREGILKKGGVMNIREHIKEQGRWEGLQQGKQEGLRQGKQENLQEIVANMLKEKLGIPTIAKCTGLSKKEISLIKSKLNGKSEQ